MHKLCSVCVENREIREIAMKLSSLPPITKQNLLRKFCKFVNGAFKTRIFCSYLSPWKLHLPGTYYDVHKSVPKLFTPDTVGEMKIFMDRLIYVYDDENIYYAFVESHDSFGNGAVDLVLSKEPIYLADLLKSGVQVSRSIL